MNSAVACPQCKGSLPGVLCNTGDLVICPVCDATIQVEVFPANFQSPQPTVSSEGILEPGVSSCFYHDQKKAVVHCDGCGRFLCALCDLEMGNQHLCPVCLQSSRKKGSIPELENRRTLYDGAALSLALLPILLGPLSLLTAPAAICLGIMSFFKPGSVVPRTRVRAYFAIGLALLQIGAWIVIIYMAVRDSQTST